MASKTTERGRGTGPDLATALAAALAAVVEVDQDDIEVTLDLPADVTFPARLSLEITVEDEAAAGSGTVGGRSLDVDAHDVDSVDETSGTRSAADAVETNSPRSTRPARRSRGDASAATAPAAAATERPETPEVVLTAEELDQEADAAADFLEGLLDALDLPGDLRIKVHADHAEIEIVDIGNGALIGRRGQTLEAIQELVRCTLQRQFQRRSHIKVDAEGYRARRLEKLVEKTEEAIDEVLDTGESVRLEPMDVFERKTVHQMVGEIEGLTSRSQGREPARRVVILKE